MEFVFETTYDRKATTAMAKGLRKTVRKKHSRRSHFFGWIVIILGLLLSWPSEAGIEKKNVVTWIVIAILLLVTVFEDQLNGWLARKRMLPGSAHAKATFTEEGYHKLPVAVRYYNVDGEIKSEDINSMEWRPIDELYNP